MNTSINCILGLQLSQNVNVETVIESINNFNHRLFKSNYGKIICASIHKKNIQSKTKDILVISFNKTANLESILRCVPDLHDYKRYLVVEIATSNKKDILQDVSFEKFLKEIENNNVIYYPQNNLPQCIVRSIYNHYYCLDGDVIYYSSTPIFISKGKYFARQLYYEYHIDEIKTPEGYKLPSDAIIAVNEENVFPKFFNKKIVLPVEEVKNNNKLEDLLSNKFKIVIN